MATEQSTKAAIDKVLGQDKPKRENIYPLKQGKGELLPEGLRELPSELVTKDAEEEDKVHRLDPKHVRLSLTDEYFDKHTKEPEVEAEKPKNKWLPVKQEFVDLVILRAMAAIIETEESRQARGHPPRHPVYHLWFPENDLRVYELRKGNPPPATERPRHLRSIDLVVDITHLPRRIKDMIRKDPKRRAIYQGTLEEYRIKKSWERQSEIFSDDNRLIQVVQ